MPIKLTYPNGFEEEVDTVQDVTTSIARNLVEPNQIFIACYRSAEYAIASATVFQMVDDKLDTADLDLNLVDSKIWEDSRGCLVDVLIGWEPDPSHSTVHRIQ